jgi:hypothetical protein
MTNVNISISQMSMENIKTDQNRLKHFQNIKLCWKLAYFIGMTMC